jgi:hypothetical protein
MHLLEISILKTVAYFDVFSYPLTADEIVFFLDQPVTEKEISNVLENLVQAGQLWQFNDFFTIKNEVAYATRRVKGNMLAIKYIKRARAVAKFLSWFPYIKGIAISGSLSKNFADEDADLDFFIITTANRLWIVRMLYAVLFKIATAAGIKNWFCLNYFIDELDLEIKEHNIFTAVEVSTLIALKGEIIFKKFFVANDWVYRYLPNYEHNYKHLQDASPVIPKRMAEWVMNFEIGNTLDNKLHSFFKKRFKRILSENKLSEKGLRIGSFEADKHACKPLPQYFQPKILAKFHDRFKSVENKYYRQLADNQRTLTTNVNDE